MGVVFCGVQSLVLGQGHKVPALGEQRDRTLCKIACKPQPNAMGQIIRLSELVRKK